MGEWRTIYETNGKLPDGRDKCIRIWSRQWFAGVGDGFISRDGERLEAEGTEAQRLYDECLREYRESVGIMCSRCVGKGYFLIGSDECKCPNCNGNGVL